MRVSRRDDSVMHPFPVSRRGDQPGPARLIIAIPVIAASTLAIFRAEADQIICAVSPKPFAAASSLYDEAAEPTDQEIRNLLERFRSHRAALFASRG